VGLSRGRAPVRYSGKKVTKYECPKCDWSVPLNVHNAASKDAAARAYHDHRKTHEEG
jgi:hypothetical protein